MKKFNCAGFFNTFFCDKKKKLLLIFIPILIFGLLVAISFSVSILFKEEIKSVEITSNDWNEKSPVPGSWHITKSSDWIGSNTAEIKFEVISEMKLADEAKDIILILDTSESMAATKYIEGKEQSKIDRMKEDAKALAEKVLSKSDNRIALVEFNTGASTLSEFTNDSNTIVSKINSLGAYGATNYRAALEEAGKILENANYKHEDGRDLVILFLSDGVPIYETPNQIGEYKILKENYPEVIVHAVQYEMGSEVVQELKDISDRQYLAYIDNLKNKLFEASTAIKFYEEFDVADFIDTKNFYINSEEDIAISNGTFELDKENQKVIWHLGSYDAKNFAGTYMSGSNATMTIKIELNDDLKNTVGLFDTNEKESIVYHLYNENSKTINSTKTPKLYNGYEVKYDTNPPTGCNIKAEETEIHSVLDIVKLKDEVLVCDGYQFKGWTISEEDEKYLNTEEYEKDKKYKINDASFRMPRRDINVKATWTKLEISKSMVGKIYEVKKVSLYDKILEEGIDPTLGRIPIDNEQSQYVSASTGIDFAVASSDTNGKGLYIREGSENDTNPIYYYRGAVPNNNVLFAGFCWKIVRTTETGGIKLVYNGEPTNGQCKTNNTSYGINNGDNYTFNSGGNQAYNGYMYGKVYSSEDKKMNGYPNILDKRYISTDAIYYYTKSVPTWNGSKYVLNDNLDVNGIDAFADIWTNVGRKLTNGGYYTCLSATVGGSCSSVYYIIRADSNNIYYFLLSSGNDILNTDKSITIGKNIVENGDGTSTLLETVTIKKSDWYENYGLYKNYYICSNFTDITCDSFEMYYLTSTSNVNFNWTVAKEIVFGNDVEYKNGVYTLKDIKTKSKKASWSATTFDKNHYTCLNDKTSCDKVYYIYYMYNSSGYHIKYITLNGEKNVDEALKEMFANQTDSTIKKEIDKWYKSNLYDKNYSNYLENAVWCNDRSISNYNGWNKDNSNSSGDLIYGAKGTRNLFQANSLKPVPGLKDNVACKNVDDRFTINDTNTGKGNGNGDLLYPIGLLTVDEFVVAGKNINNYLYESINYSKFKFWMLSPHAFSTTAASNKFTSFNFSSTEKGGLVAGGTANNNGARVAISLKSDTQVLETGDGTSSNPYRIE